MSSESPEQRYKKLRKKGVSPKLAEMLAYQSPPGAKGTDRAFWDGRLSAFDGMNEANAKKMREQALAAGIDITGKYYVGQLADKRGAADPKAWVSDRHDIKKAAEIVEAQRIAEHLKPKPRLNPRIVERIAARMIKQDPAQALRDPRELREEIIEKHGSKKAPEP